MTISLNSPNVENYYVGKGVVFIKFDGDVDYVDVGNVTELEFTPNLEKLDHFSSREGVRTKDRSIVIEKSAELKMVMEEYTARNLSMLLLGEITDVSGAITIDIFSTNVKTAAVRFVGANEIGPQWTLDFPRVDFAPSGSMNPISDEWGTIEVTGEVVTVDGSFGTATATFPDSP
jgi:hypothetical protein